MTKLFSGTASRKLSEEVGKLLNIKISSSLVTRFANSEIKIGIKEDVKNDTAIIIQSTSNPTNTNLMELLFFCDALKREEAKKVIAIIPYFGYSRQEVQHSKGECVSANVVIRFLESIGFNKVYTFDIHNKSLGGIFSIPFKNISALPLLAESVKRYVNEKGIPLEQVAIVSPDEGGIERARNFGVHFFGKTDFPLAVIDKVRSSTETHKSIALGLYGDVEGKTAIIVDDVTTSGGTIINAANLCVGKGAKDIIGVVVHADFNKDALDKIKDSVISKFFTTNTIQSLGENLSSNKLIEVSIAPKVAEEIHYLF